MAIDFIRNRLSVLAILIPLLHFPCLQAASQEAPEALDGVPQKGDKKNYFLLQDGESSIVFQTLEWNSGKHTKWYEVLLELLDDQGNWVPVQSILPENMNETISSHLTDIPEPVGGGVYKTTRNRITISLPAKESGEVQKYRYRVTSYNLLGQKSFSTEFQEFQIQKAFIPEISGISHDTIYLDTLYDPSIRVSGTQLKESTNFYLTKEDEILRPLEVTVEDNARRANLVFDPKAFDVGEWRLTAENPGEFISEYPLTIKFMKWYDISISAGYSPSFVLYDQNINEYFGTVTMPAGADFRVTFIPLKRRAGYFGVSLNAKWNMIGGTFTNHDIQTHLMHSSLSATYRYQLIRNRLVLEARLGGGITTIMGLQFSFPHDLASQTFTSIFPSATAGVSLTGFLWRNLYMEVGSDFNATFTPNMLIITASPTLSFGILL